MTALARNLSAEELARRLEQQELVAGLGLHALGTASLDAVLHEACRVAALGLQTDFAKVLRLLPGSQDLLVVAGIGWRPGVVGHATLGGGLESPAGFALHSGGPVLSNSLREESRFRVPALLAEHGVQSAINVAIGAPGQPPYGVLEVDSTARHGFVEADTTFLQALANVLAAAMIRHDMDGTAARQQALARQVFESSPDCVKVLDLDGQLLAMNANGLIQLEMTEAESRQRASWPAWWSTEAQTLAHGAVAQAAAGHASRFTASTINKAGLPVWWDVAAAPVLDMDGQPFRLVVISRNITAEVEAGQAKDALLRDKDLLMQEVHHRVKNSLQLVRTLLHLQARAASPETRAQLDQAAGRILTIGAVHQRLYEGGSVTETDAAAYLEALMGDISVMLSDSANGWTFVLDAEPVMLTADQVTPLGLIVSELVTNAVKYGGRCVRVGLRRVAAGLEVAVQDDGPGFPADFTPDRRSGLGMRLITALAKGDGARAIRVDRDAPGSRVVVTITL